MAVRKKSCSLCNGHQRHPCHAQPPQMGTHTREKKRGEISSKTHHSGIQACPVSHCELTSPTTCCTMSLTQGSVVYQPVQPPRLERMIPTCSFFVATNPDLEILRTVTVPSKQKMQSHALLSFAAGFLSLPKKKKKAVSFFPHIHSFCHTSPLCFKEPSSSSVSKQNYRRKPKKTTSLPNTKNHLIPHNTHCTNRNECL